MNRRILLLLPLALAPMALVARAQEPAAAQPELPKEQITIVTKDGQRHPFNVELATTPAQQMTGEMFRTSVPPDGGMLFVWPAVQDSPMWMKNTLVPLDMVFINPDGTIRKIAEDTVPQSLRVIDSGGPVAATLELAGGTASRLGITPGDKVIAPQFHAAG
ncbi:MAG TPA: DUF192 domain-containing protein [Acetobacteraceae bacterium]|jgi:uncharacterized membrane protein (UPF0127 family)|nr:DUF192 domain-containing protein [Acetobacteraceae bacterium]